MSKVALLTVHGMGETKKDYAQELLDGLEGRLGKQWANVSRHVVYYQDSLQPNEDLVWSKVSKDKVHYDGVRKFLLYGFADAAGLENRKEQADSVYVDAQLDIAKNLLDAFTALNGDGPVIAISQSLGCQVLSSYLWDAQQATPSVGIWKAIDQYAGQIAGRKLTPAEDSFLRGRRLQRWITTGCNIPIFVAAHKTMDIKPIIAPAADKDFEWLNLYDPDDVLGWPLGGLSEKYAQLVKDQQINSGQGLVDWIFKSWNPMSHTTYWTDNDVLDPLEQMLRHYLPQ